MVTPPIHPDVDVLVVGGGAAGLSAALVLGRSRRSVLVVDAGEPRNAPAEAVHAFLTRDGTPPDELLALGRAEVARLRRASTTRDACRARPATAAGSASTSTTAAASSPGGWW